MVKSTTYERCSINLLIWLHNEPICVWSLQNIHTHTTHVRCSSFCLSLIFASYSLFVRFDWFLFRVFLALLVVFVVFLRMNISFSVHNSTVRLHSRFAFFRLRLLKYIVSRTMPADRSLSFSLFIHRTNSFIHLFSGRVCVDERNGLSLSVFFCDIR